MSQILLVEDDPVLGRGLMVNLELEGYAVQWERDLMSAFQAKERSRIDLVVLDLGLPDGNGLRLLKEIRASQNLAKLPVVILTAKTDEDSVVEGLHAGANDYIRKPFSNRELLARIQVALRTTPSREPHIQFERLTLRLEQRKATWGEKEIELNRREFDILYYFVQHAEKVVTREALLEALDKNAEIYDRTVDSHVSHLRNRLRQAGVDGIQISSVYGVGYRLEKID